MDQNITEGPHDVAEPNVDVYEDFQELIRTFTTRKMNFEHHILVDDVKFKYVGGTRRDFIDYVSGKKAAIIFGTPFGEKAKQNAMNENLVFVWKITETNTLSPLGIMPTTRARRDQFLVREQEQTQNTIGDVSDVLIVKPAGFAFGSSIKGKVDTGASMCSLHVDTWKDLGSEIEFTSNVLADGKTFRIPKDTMIAIKSAEDMEYRPVVTMSLKIGDVVIPDVEVNLNNRAQMKHPLLIGQNALEKGKFLIDPSKTKETYESEQTDEIDWEHIEKLIEQFDFEEQTKDFRIEAQYNRILESDVSFEDILRHVKTEAIKAVEKVKY